MGTVIGRMPWPAPTKTNIFGIVQSCGWERSAVRPVTTGNPPLPAAAGVGQSSTNFQIQISNIPLAFELVRELSERT